jgi:hypothetical protein
MVLKPVILTTWDVEMEDPSSRLAKATKFPRPHFNQWLGVVAHVSHPSYAEKHK